MFLRAVLCVVALSLCGADVTHIENIETYHEILRTEGVNAMVLAYDSTHENGVLQYESFVEGSSGFDLFANLYTIDTTKHPLLTRAYGYAEAGYQHLFYGNFKKGSASGGAVPRPGGVRKPQRLQIPAAQIKPFLLSKLPEISSKRLKKVKSKDALGAAIEEIEGHQDKTFAVLFSDKDKVPPVLKAIAVRSPHIEQIFIVTVSSAEAAGVKKLPSLVLYTGTERTLFEGTMYDRASIESFLFEDSVKNREEKTAAAIAADTAEVKLLVKKHLRPVAEVRSVEAWEEEVMNEQLGLVLVAFLDESAADEKETYLKMLTEIAKSERSSIKSVAWVSTEQTYNIMERLGVEAGSLVFFNANLGKWMRFTGSPTAKNVNNFVKKMKHSKDIGTLPAFGE